MIKRIFLLTTICCLMVFLTSCISDSLEIIADSELEVGETIKLSSNVKTDDMIWSSSNEEIAIIVDGVLLAISSGKVTIILKVGKEVATKVITVVKCAIEIVISGKNTISIGETTKLTTTLSKETNDKVMWSTTNSDIASVDEEGNVIGKSAGNTKIIASIYDSKKEFEIKVLPNEYYISIVGKSSIGIGEQYQFNVVDFYNESVDAIWEVSDEKIGTITKDGIFVGIECGTISIVAYLKDNIAIYNSFEVQIIIPAPKNIILSGDDVIEQGKINTSLELEFIGGVVNEDVIWKSSNPKVALVHQGTIMGITPGTTTITAHSVLDEKVYGELKVTVNKHQSPSITQEELKRVEEIIDNMTLSQKIGQMFVVGFNGTEIPSSLVSAIENYNLGNIIYMTGNVANSQTLVNLSNSIQEMMVMNNGIPAFITIDQEGGRVVRLTDGGTHFISNMALCATSNENNAYLEGKAIASELRNYGINVDFAPVLDVNNNPDNPIIGIRSYSDNPLIVAIYGNKMIEGLNSANVMACTKHFPGHGNTSVDSHYGLPMITSTIEELYQTELAPFISAIANDVDAIMTTHIIFSAIDEEYPATLSKKVLTNLLREELGYEGIIFTDGMEMQAVKSGFGGYDETAVLAVKAGVDILTYTSTSNPIIAHQALIEAVTSGEITEERINESVRRILLKKLKYGILDNYLTDNNNINELLKINEELNLQLAKESLTLVKGNFNGLNKTKSTLIISPTTTYSLGNDLNNNSFSNFAANYLTTNNHVKVDYLTVSKNVTMTEKNQILNLIDNYDQIVVAMSNVKTSNYTNTSNLINEISSKKDNLIVIALDTPYDMLAYQNINNYICVYGYQKATVIALAKYLNGEFIASGKLPINSEIFE